MAQDEGIRNTKKVIWGVFLIALGVLFLFERFVPWGLAGLGEWWPLILVVIGITHLVERRVGSALTMILWARGSSRSRPAGGASPGTTPGRSCWSRWAWASW